MSSDSPQTKADGAPLSWKVEYDGQGRIAAEIDPAGRRTTFEYQEGAGVVRCLGIKPSEGTEVRWNFDESGRLIQMKDSEGSTSYVYDRKGRLQKVQRTEAPVIAYAYDLFDRKVRTSVGDLYSIDYGYDFLGRLVKQTVRTQDPITGRQAEFPISYDYRSGDGLIIRTLPNGIKTRWTHNPIGELQEIVHVDAENFILTEHSYAHDPQGRIASIKERSRRGELTEIFTYDKVGRLIQAARSDGRLHSYTYDLVGNRLAATASARPPQAAEFDWAGRLTSLDGQPCRYDAAGNLIVLTLNGTALRFHYYADGRLAEAQNGNRRVQYRYDGEGLLIARRGGTGEARFVCDPLSRIWQPLLILEPHGNPSLVVWDGATPLIIIHAGKPEYFLHDHLGSVRVIVDAGGRLSQYLDYDPFGTPAFNESPRAGLQPGFAGLFWDVEAGSYLTLARAYIPQIGCFQQPDSIHRLPIDPRGENSLFQYCGGNPICLVDRRGQAGEWYTQPESWTSPNFLSAYSAEFRRSMAEQVNNDLLRARALSGKIAYVRAQADGALEHLGVELYDPDQMTLFVREFHPLNIPSTIVPHTGIYFGREMDLAGLRLDGIELKIAQVGGRDSMTVINPIRLNADEPGGAIRLQPLETDLIRVRFENRTMPIRDLPASKKAAIQSILLRRSLAEMGQTRGTYQAVGPGRSNSCVDMALSLLDQSVEEAGLRFEGGSFRDRFTTHVGIWSAANPTSFLGGLAASIPRRPDLGDSLASELRELNGEIARGLALEWAENLPGKWGKGITYFNRASEIWDHFASATETARYLREHPEDPAGDLLIFSFVLNVLGLLPGFSMIGSATSVVDLGIKLGMNARSRVLQNRAEGLVEFGGAVLLPVTERMERSGPHDGGFSLYGRGYSARGGWRLTGSYQGWLGRDRDFKAWAVSRVLNLSTAQGERISGELSRFEERYERGAGLFNLYEPRSLTITRGSHDVYRIRKGGGSTLLEEPTTRREIPPPEAPEVVLEGKPPYIHRRQEFPPERRDPLFPPPRRRRLPVDEDPPDDAPAAAAPSGGDPGGGGAAMASPVGGVYLSGFIGTFEGFGTLKGVQLDPNGNLVLLATADGDVKTPPLRLDDVVTVFRSVYLHGEGPTVTIDPASQDPKKAPMIIRHSKATERTYVGWVLYQADRLMKGYTLGTDNITEQEVLSGVPGHREVLDTIYFGGGDLEKRQKEGYWERFWIVPAEARRFEGPRHELTLFNVPLKVNTQSMKWKRGELVDDLTTDSSPGAKAFTAWFTASYDQIATEQYLMPPPKSGLTQPVPVFAELQRIALITAIAEKLRDEGVPIPFWMRDYKVRAVPFETTTPGLQVVREQGNVSTCIFGGVNLSPGSRDVKTFSSVTQPAGIPPEERNDVVQEVQSAATLEDALSTRPTLVGTPPLRLERIVYQEKEFCALAVPGAATRAVGACRLDEVDLWVPLSDGRSLQLIRHYNSFFAPEGPWGAGWTLDLPRLAEISIPIQRERDSVRYAIARELITPLNSHYARFREQRVVPELGDSRLLVPDREDGPFYGLASDQPKFLRKRETLLLIRKDGARWHFTSQGDLVALEEGGLVTLYDRASDGRITRIVGLLGGVEEAAITLHYDKQGLLDHAEASSASGSPSRLRVDYEYDSSRRLAGIRSFQERVGYRYEGPWVNAITWQACDGKGKSVGEEIVLRTFAYNSQGQLLEESVGSTTTRHTILAGTDALTVTSTTGERDQVESIRYDSRLRPLESIAANGTHTRWHYASEGGVEIEITKSDQSAIRMIQSVKARRWTLHVGDAPPLEANYDVAGRLVALNEGGQKLLDQQWRFDGQLTHVGTEYQAASFQYNDSGFLSSVIEHPSAEEGTFNHWQETTYDRQGRPIALANHEGLKLKMAYDASGSLSSVAQKTTKGDMGFDLRRENQGRLQTVKSSWGDTAFTYDKEGGLRQVVTTRNGRKAQIELEGGALRRRIGFDGGETAFEYYREGRLAGLPREISSPDGLRLKFGYDDRGRLARIRVGQARKVAVTYDEFGRPTAYAWVPVSE